MAAVIRHEVASEMKTKAEGLLMGQKRPQLEADLDWPQDLLMEDVPGPH